MALPRFTITGNLQEILGDVDGTNHLVETALTRATVVFESNLGNDALVTFDGVDYVINRVVARIDTDGNIVNDEGDPVLLLAQDDGLNITGLQWQVSIFIQSSTIPPVANKQIRPWWIDAAGDGDEIDLADVTPVPGVSIHGSAAGIRAMAGLDNVDNIRTDIVLPSYVTLRDRPNAYDPGRNAYNLKASNTRHLRASLGKAATGSLQHWMVIGDSIPAGFMGSGSTPQFEPTRAWPRTTRSSLVAQGIPVGGTGFVPLADATQLAADSRWTINSGSWTVFGGTGGFASTASSGGQATFLSDTAGTQVDVWYYGTGGPFTVAIDGGSAVTPPAGATVVPMKYTVTGLANTTHSVVITASNTTTRFIIGAAVTNTSGLVINNLAVSATRSIHWTLTSTGSVGESRLGSFNLLGVTPACLLIELGGNDFLSSVPSATFKSQMTTIRNLYPNSDVVLLAIPDWPDLLEEHYDLADAFDCPLVDWFDRYGGSRPAGGVLGTLGLISDSPSDIHPNQAWHADAGRNLGSLMGQ